jgi:hypothetical protein
MMRSTWLAITLMIMPSLATAAEPSITEVIRQAYQQLAAYGDEGTLSISVKDSPGAQPVVKTLEMQFAWVREPILLSAVLGPFEYARTTVSFFKVDHAARLVLEGDISPKAVQMQWVNALEDPNVAGSNASESLTSMVFAILFDLQSGKASDLLSRFRIEPVSDPAQRGLILKSTDGVLVVQVFIDEANLMRSARVDIAPSALSNAVAAGESPPASISALWRAGRVSTSREEVIDQLRKRLDALDQRIEQYDHVRLSPAGVPSANYVQVQTTLKDRLRALVQWIRGS